MDQDVVDSGLIDISSLSMGQLLTEGDGSALAKALNWIFASDKDDAYCSFSASI